MNYNLKMEVDRAETLMVGSTELGGDRRDLRARQVWF